MSILIKGMEMPGNCAGCFMRFSGCEQRIYQEYRPKGCPLVEVPKHGRLIDADALAKTIAEHVYPVADYFNSRDYGMFWTGGIEKAINEQSTIIEAEEET